MESKDRFALEAASGWLMLGNAAEARRELNEISAGAREHPEVLLLLWDIQARNREWEMAIDTAGSLISQSPDQPEGYIKRAYALHELRRTQEAWDTLHPISQDFEEVWLIPYNLACYAAQLGRLAEALKWFRRALRVGDPVELRSMALADADLQPIHSNVERLTSR